MLLRAGALLLIPVGIALAFNPNLPLDRPFTLRSQSPLLLELDYYRMLSGKSGLGFIRPRPCNSPLDTSGECFASHRIAYGPDSAGTYAAIGPIGAEEIRHDGELIGSTEAGAQLEGGKGPASFRLDARIFSETEGPSGRPSFDRESIDEQDGAVTGSVSYRSYARYRGEFDLDLPFGRLSAGRDAAHWGPGLLGNLVMNRDAVPYEQVSFTTWLGPLSVISLYGDLTIGENQAYDSENLEGRNLYAHRYELRLGPDWVLGVSEQLILYGHDKPLLFAPMVPLFIAKTLMYENANNGNLSADAAYRVRGVGMLYGEFLLDDLESPSSLLLKDYIQNKWAMLLGVHFMHGFAAVKAGLVVEYARVEPWVYTHFVPGTSQTANAGYPLGNQQGPDSRSLSAKAYGVHPSGISLSALLSYQAKGTGPGSGLEDSVPSNPLIRKGDFSARSRSEWFCEPAAAYTRGHAALSAGGTFGSRNRAWARIAYVY